jgi:hypothetical protein
MAVDTTTRTINAVGQSVAYALAGTDKTININFGTTAYAGFTAVSEISSDAGATWQLQDARIPPMGNRANNFPVPASGGMFPGFGVDVSAAGITHWRMRAGSWQGGTLTATITGYSFVFMDPTNVGPRLDIASPGGVANVVLSLPTLARASGDSGPLHVPAFNTLSLGVNVTAKTGTNPTLNLSLDQLGADGVWYSLYAPTQLTDVGVVTQTIGPRMETTKMFGSIVRLSWVVGGTATPKFTFTASILGKV